jgi:hypothetical protein
MCERQNTIVCSFDLASPRISAFQIHEWLHDTFRLHESDVRMVQVDGPRRQVYVKFTDLDRMQTVFQSTSGQAEFWQDTGEIGLVKIEMSGMGTRRIRIANVPRRKNDTVIQSALSQYGDVKNINEEQWSRMYRYPVSNGVCISVVALKHNIPSDMNMDGNRVLITYNGQPLTCYGCGEIGHQYQACPHRRRPRQPTAP